MSRFDDPKHLEWWASGVLPAIYLPMVNMALSRREEWEPPVLDFACGTGVLGATIGTLCHCAVVGTDGNERRVQLGQDYGIAALEVKRVRTPEDVTEYGRWVKHIGFRTVLMRRAIADVFEGNPQVVRQFTAELEGAGVRHLLVEGRVEVRNATNPFPTIAHEVAALAPHFREVERRGRLSFLEVSPA